MPARILTVDEIMAILPETPRQIAALTSGASAAQLRAVPEPDAWSVNDVLAHLRASSDVLGGNILRIIEEDHPSFRRVSPRAWLRKTDYPDWEFAPALTAFERQRAGLLAVLGPLPPEDWERTATVTERPGRTVERSVLYYADWLASHERVHRDQIEQIVVAVRARV